MIEGSCSYCGDGEVDVPNAYSQIEACDLGDAN